MRKEQIRKKAKRGEIERKDGDAVQVLSNLFG